MRTRNTSTATEREMEEAGFGHGQPVPGLYWVYVKKRDPAVVPSGDTSVLPATPGTVGGHFSSPRVVGCCGPPEGRALLTPTAHGRPSTEPPAPTAPQSAARLQSTTDSRRRQEAVLRTAHKPVLLAEAFLARGRPARSGDTPRICPELRDSESGVGAGDAARGSRCARPPQLVPAPKQGIWCFLSEVSCFRHFIHSGSLPPRKNTSTEGRWTGDPGSLPRAGLGWS